MMALQGKQQEIYKPQRFIVFNSKLQSKLNCSHRTHKHKKNSLKRGAIGAFFKLSLKMAHWPTDFMISESYSPKNMVVII